MSSTVVLIIGGIAALIFFVAALSNSEKDTAYLGKRYLTVAIIITAATIVGSIAAI